VRRTPSFGDSIVLKPDEFRLLRDLFVMRTGLQFGPESRFALERRLRERLMVLKLTSFAEYHHYLRFGTQASAEWDEAIDLLTTNETYFFREEYQLRAFQAEVLPELADRASPRKRLTFWSAGCSTGEEVYTLAMLIAETGRFDDWEVRVFGNDISKRVLAVARRAVYGQSSFRAMPPRHARWFIETPDGRLVDERIRAMCHFGHMNLLDAGRSALLGRVDAIFCRNVLIYFDATSRRKVIDSFYERLQPGGYLFLGHSESLLHVTTAFEIVHLSSDLVYRRPLYGPQTNGDRR
jgi:chemotaxis protein methyltransferase CheR